MTKVCSAVTTKEFAMGLLVIGAFMVLLLIGSDFSGQRWTLEQRKLATWFTTPIFGFFALVAFSALESAPLAPYILSAAIAGIALAWGLYLQDWRSSLPQKT